MTQVIAYRYRVLILLFTLILLTYLDRIAISLVGVRIKTAFHLTNVQFGYAVGAFALAYALFEIPAGVMGDRLGQRRVLIRIVLWWSFFTAFTGLTTGLASLVITRFLFGVGEAGAFPNATGVVSRWFPARETGRGISSLIIGLNFGAAIAPLIVVPIALAWGWRAPFFVNGLIGILWVFFFWRWFRDEPRGMKGISSGEVEIIENNRRLSQHGLRFGWQHLMRQRNIWLMMLAFFASQWGLYFFVAWMSIYLQQGRHLSEDQMKLLTTALFTAGILGALSSGFVNDRLAARFGLKRSRRLIGATALLAEGLGFIIASSTQSTELAVICLVLAQFFSPLFSSTAFATCVDTGGSQASTVSGVMNFAGQIGAFLLALTFGKIADVTHSYDAPLRLIAGVLLTGAFAWFFVDASRPFLWKKEETGAGPVSRQMT